MKSTAQGLLLFLVLAFCGTTVAHGQISYFEHVIVVFQENRTPDNLFQGLCTAPFGSSSSCSTHPTGSQYNIQTSKWLDNTSSTGTTDPGTIELANAYDLYHIHKAYTAQCDINSSGVCRMDGAAGVTCTAPALRSPSSSTSAIRIRS